MQICKQCKPLSVNVLNEFSLCFALFFNKKDFNILGEFIIFINKNRLSYGIYEIVLDTQSIEFFNGKLGISLIRSKNKKLFIIIYYVPSCVGYKYSVTSIVRQVVPMLHFVVKG